MKLLHLLPAALLLASAVAAAEDRGDAELGRIQSYTCTGCHGIANYKNVYPTYRVPLIGGQTYEYIVAALTAYRDGTRRHPTMRAQAQGMSDQEIRNIAAYLSSLAD